MRALVAAAAAVAVTLGGWALISSGAGPLPDRQRCVATVTGHSAVIDLEQAHHAATIAAVAVRRGLPARAVSIALATAYQESDIRNLDYGDRDSLGIFQQRPSQGWGTAAQVTDPAYAANRFYDALERVPGYQTMAITDAAQLVQRSAFGGAYADHEADARALASALTGYSRGAFFCVVRAPGRAVDGVAAALRDLRGAFGAVQAQRRPARSFAVAAPTSVRRWAIASYLVANADRLSLSRVAVGARVWTAGDRSKAGWRRTGASTPAGVVSVRVR